MHRHDIMENPKFNRKSNRSINTFIFCNQNYLHHLMTGNFWLLYIFLERSRTLDVTFECHSIEWMNLKIHVSELNFDNDAWLRKNMEMLNFSYDRFWRKSNELIVWLCDLNTLHTYNTNYWHIHFLIVCLFIYLQELNKLTFRKDYVVDRLLFASFLFQF